MITAQRLAVDQLLVVKKSTVYSLFCIYVVIIVIIIISSSISIPFIVLSNCLYLDPWVSSFMLFCSPSCWGGRGEVSKGLSTA